MTFLKTPLKHIFKGDTGMVTFQMVIVVILSPCWFLSDELSILLVNHFTQKDCVISIEGSHWAICQLTLVSYVDYKDLKTAHS